MFVPNFKILGTVVPEKSLTKNKIGKKEKWTNKGTDKPYVADSQYNLSYPMFVPNFKILGTVVLEKSLTKKKFTHKLTHTHTHTHTHTEKAKTIYTLYTSYTGGIITSDF